MKCPLRTTLSQLTSPALLQSFRLALAQERQAIMVVIEHIVEIDGRRLYLPAGYSSMYTYCVGAFRMKPDAAFTRIRVARAARRFPDILAALADGRLCLTVVRLLTPYLKGDGAAELLAAAEHKSKAEIELLLAQRFPCPLPPAFVRPIGSVGAASQLVPEPVGLTTIEQKVATNGPSTEPGMAPVHPERNELVPEPVVLTTSEHVMPAAPGAGMFLLQVAIESGTHEVLRYIQALLGHTVPKSDIATVIDGALRVYAEHLEKGKIGAASRSHPGRRRRRVANERYVPMAVRRAVWERDGAQCTFVSESGHRCGARECLEFDHVVPVVRGGQATVENIRLLCRAHNQFAAEGEFGRGFMDGKREAGRTPPVARQVRLSRSPDAGGASPSAPLPQ